MKETQNEKFISSRAEYFRERRKIMKQFNVMLDRDKVEKFEKILNEQNKTKVKWMNEKIDEELKRYNN